MDNPKVGETIVPPIDTVEHIHTDTTIQEKDETAVSRPTPVHSPVSSHSSEHSTIVADSEDVERAPNVLTRVITPRRDPVNVPRNQRRGWLARFALLPEVENPYDYSNPVKWFITFIVAFAAVAAPLGSSIFFRTFSKLT